MLSAAGRREAFLKAAVVLKAWLVLQRSQKYVTIAILVTSVQRREYNGCTNNKYFFTYFLFYILLVF